MSPEAPDGDDRLAEFTARLADKTVAGRGLLAVLAHPDDEAIGFGGHLAHLHKAGLICLTNGAPIDLRDARHHGFEAAEEYATARRNELMAALAVAGFPVANLQLFCVPDQQVVHNLRPLVARLRRCFAEARPNFVLTHAYEGGHPDHDATALAVAVACATLERAGEVAPTVVEMPFYHLGPGGTVYQRFIDSSLREHQVRLSASARATKAKLLACHATQAETLRAFSTDIERFRLAPRHDFHVLPNGGRLQYEQWGLGTGAEWLRLVRGGIPEREAA